MTQIFDEKTKMGCKRIKGQVFLEIQIICEGSTSSDKISFLYDTGAYITVINRYWYEWYGLNKLPRFETSLHGYVGLAPGYVFQIPGLMIGQRLLTGVWVFTPTSMDATQNLLGDNVIEYFKPYQDNENDCFYFPDNPQPKPYIHTESNFSLACDSVFHVSETHTKQG